ncbi:MAG TPA: hypothetical protein VGM36_08000 [Rhizomicrobium sp.]|jgi:hypothetical protein
MPAGIFQQQFDQRAAVAASRGEPAPAKAASNDDDSGFSFDDFLDVINPLQHLPVISTIYRALTHDTIKPVERIAGDTLYGGLWGFVSSVANVAFEKITGKDFGDTAIALLTGGKGSDTGVAANTSPAQQVASAAPAKLSALASTGQQTGVDPVQDSTIAFASAMQSRNMPSDISLRAMAAYKRAIDVTQPYGALSPIF